MRRASFACARCEPHAFLRPACAARTFARAALLRCARSPHRIEMAKRQRPPEWNRWRFSEITLASRGIAVLRLASLKLLAHAGCYAGGSPVLAVPSCTGVCGGPTHPLPSPRSREGRHHGDRLAGRLTPFIRLGGAWRPRATGGAVRYSAVWVQYGIESGGGVKPPAAIARLSLRFRAAYHFLSFYPAPLC